MFCGFGKESELTVPRRGNWTTVVESSVIKSTRGKRGEDLGFRKREESEGVREGSGAGERMGKISTRGDRLEQAGTNVGKFGWEGCARHREKRKDGESRDKACKTS